MTPLVKWKLIEEHDESDFPIYMLHDTYLRVEGLEFCVRLPLELKILPPISEGVPAVVAHIFCMRILSN